MKKIKIETNPSAEHLNELNVFSWPIWTKEESEFPWHYESEETCYFLEGDVEVIPYEGELIRIRKGDLVVFPSGMSCTWKVHKAVKKHYRFK